MSPEPRELFRRALLEALDANGTRYGLGLAALRLHLAPFGFPGSNTADIERELLYLIDKGFVAEVTKAVSPELRSWRITAPGRDHLASQP